MYISVFYSFWGEKLKDLLIFIFGKDMGLLSICVYVITLKHLEWRILLLIFIFSSDSVNWWYMYIPVFEGFWDFWDKNFPVCFHIWSCTYISVFYSFWDEKYPFWFSYLVVISVYCQYMCMSFLWYIWNRGFSYTCMAVFQ